MEEVSRTVVAMERLGKHVRGDVTTTVEALQAAFSLSPLRGYMTRPTEFCSESECSAVDGSAIVR
jgi:hypothetical protein